MSQVDSGTTSTDNISLVTAPAVPVVNSAFATLPVYAAPTATVTGYGFADADTMDDFFEDYALVRAQLAALTATGVTDRKTIAAS